MVVVAGTLIRCRKGRAEVTWGAAWAAVESTSARRTNANAMGEHAFMGASSSEGVSEYAVIQKPICEQEDNDE